MPPKIQESRSFWSRRRPCGRTPQYLSGRRVIALVSSDRGIGHSLANLHDALTIEVTRQAGHLAIVRAGFQVHDPSGNESS